MFQKVLDFFTSISKSTWQDIVLSSIFIPLVILSLSKLRVWLISLHPLNLIFKGYRNTKNDILVFISQLSGANNQGQLNPGQRYVARFPQPLPYNQANVGFMAYQNIDPVWSQSDGQCVAEVFNILGRINKDQGFRIADTVRDWNDRSNPLFSIGFNPKTSDVRNSCVPINFQLAANGTTLNIDGHNPPLGCVYPDDAGIVQKTFLENTDIPTFILAGLGTTGTEVAGRALNQNCIGLGKLYGNKPFCVLFKTDITKGNSYYEIEGIFPKPNLLRAFWYPFTFINWYRKKVFPQ